MSGRKQWIAGILMSIAGVLGLLVPRKRRVRGGAKGNVSKSRADKEKANNAAETAGTSTGPYDADHVVGSALVYEAELLYGNRPEDDPRKFWTVYSFRE